MELTNPGHLDNVRNVGINANKNILVSCCKDGTSKIWGLTDNKLKATLVDVRDNASSVAFDRNDIIAIGSWDQQVRIYKYSQKWE